MKSKPFSGIAASLLTALLMYSYPVEANTSVASTITQTATTTSSSRSSPFSASSAWPEKEAVKSVINANLGTALTLSESPLVGKQAFVSGSVSLDNLYLAKFLTLDGLLRFNQPVEKLFNSSGEIAGRAMLDIPWKANNYTYQKLGLSFGPAVRILYRDDQNKYMLGFRVEGESLDTYKDPFTVKAYLEPVTIDLKDLGLVGGVELTVNLNSEVDLQLFVESLPGFEMNLGLSLNYNSLEDYGQLFKLIYTWRRDNLDDPIDDLISVQLGLKWKDLL